LFAPERETVIYLCELMPANSFDLTHYQSAADEISNRLAPLFWRTLQRYSTSKRYGYKKVLPQAKSGHFKDRL